jgi:hypothetical protein
VAAGQSSGQPHLKYMKPNCWIVSVMAGIALTLLTPAGGVRGATQPEKAPAGKDAPAESLEARWGIQVSSLHLSANGYMIDFRYKVVDPEKAATLGDPKAKPYLVDQSTGAKMFVPRSPKVGPLRQSAKNLTTGKVYFTLFSNRGKAVKAGSKVTVSIGEFKAENLVVE